MEADWHIVTSKSRRRGQKLVSFFQYLRLGTSAARSFADHYPIYGVVDGECSMVLRYWLWVLAYKGLQTMDQVGKIEICSFLEDFFLGLGSLLVKRQVQVMSRKWLILHGVVCWLDYTIAGTLLVGYVLFLLHFFSRPYRLAANHDSFRPCRLLQLGSRTGHHRFHQSFHGDCPAGYKLLLLVLLWLVLYSSQKPRVGYFHTTAKRKQSEFSQNILGEEIDGVRLWDSRWGRWLIEFL